MSGVSVTTPERSDEVEVRNAPERGRYEIYVDSVLAGYADYHSQPGLITVLHTEIDTAFGGRGMGSELVRRMLDDIRSRNTKVLPVCPFVQAFLKDIPSTRTWFGSRDVPSRSEQRVYPSRVRSGAPGRPIQLVQLADCELHLTCAEWSETLSPLRPVGLRVRRSWHFGPSQFGSTAGTGAPTNWPPGHFRLDGSSWIGNPEGSDRATYGDEHRAEHDDLVECVDRLLVGRECAPLSALETRSPMSETPSRPATRATALLIADAMPASCSSASARTVAVSGATVSVRPSANTTSAGSRSATYDGSVPTRRSRRSRSPRSKVLRP